MSLKIYAYTNIFLDSILSRNNGVAREILYFLEEYTIVSANVELLKNALYSNFSDFEDGVQYFCAKKIQADLIISKDRKGFKESDIEKMVPIDFYNTYIKD